MTIRHCEHVKSNGHFCASPAMRGRNYCYFHIIDIGRRLRLERYAAQGLQAPPIELPLLEDAASIQLALTQVTDALLRGALDHKTAGLVLYSLQTAAINLRTMQQEAETDANAHAAVCNRYDSFEQDYELDEEAAASLRIEEPAEGENLDAQAAEIVEGAKYAGLIKDQADVKCAEDAGTEDADARLTFTDDDSEAIPTVGPVNQLDHDPIDHSVRIPLMLSKVQYEQAKVAIFGYNMMHGIDRENPNGRKPVAQRPAISQKIFVSARKPVASATAEEEQQQRATSN
jgi:hypothetical protein